MTCLNLIIYALVGLAAITLIDTVGAIASRKMNFKYAYLISASSAVYIFVAYLSSKSYSLSTVLFTNAILGLYDGTIGFWLSIILKANTGQTTEQASEILGLKSATAMIVISIILGAIGFGLSTI